MIVTRSWLNEWIDLDGITTEELAKTLNSIGLEVDSIQTYNVPSKIVFGRVVECEKHPDADKLNICKVDIGTSTRQIVCGASNVRAGLDVVVATIGATMPNGMVIKPVKLRGVESEGMICSASEIGLHECKDGIIELDSSVGTYELGAEVCTNTIFSDDIIEIELTANRGDCLSIMGVARDLSAAFDRPLKNIGENERDDKRGIGRFLSLLSDKDLNVKLKYKIVDLKDFKTSFIMDLRLSQIDEVKKTDIESVIYYTTHSTGVILRAYSYDFFLEDGATLAKVELKEDENGYASVFGKEKASTVGVIQNSISKVDYTEGMVILEASYIPPDIISKQMMMSKTESDSMFYRTSRGSEPELECGLSFCVGLIENNSKSSAYSGTIELEDNFKDKIVSVKKQEIDDIIGAQIDKVVINTILKNLGFNTSKSSMDSFVISVPQYRHDIVNKQDVIEEIVRMVGIDNIPSKPFVFSEENRLEDNYFNYKKRTVYRHRASQSGFFESVHFVFDEKKTLQKYGFETLKDELELLNPIVKTLDTLRPTLLTGLLKAVSTNRKNGYSSIKLFEVGSVFSPNREESLNIAMIFSGFKEEDNIKNGGKPQKVDFGYFAQKVADIVGEVELVEYETKHKLSHPYQCAKVILNGEMIGEIFKLHPTVQKDHDLEDTFLCELKFDKLPFGLKTATKTSKYQASFRDLSLLVPDTITYAQIKEAILENATDELVRFYPVDKYKDESLGDSASLSIRFVLQSDEKTLEEEDITKTMDSVLENLKEKFGITLR